MKISMLLLATFLLSGCGPIHTKNEIFDGFYNAAVERIQRKRDRKNCDQTSAIERKKCRNLRDFLFEKID